MVDPQVWYQVLRPNYVINEKFSKSFTKNVLNLLRNMQGDFVSEQLL